MKPELLGDYTTHNTSIPPTRRDASALQRQTFLDTVELPDIG